MEQRTKGGNKKKLWSVYVFIRTGPDTFKKYLYLDVTKMFKKLGMLHIWCGKQEKHIHDLKRIDSVQIREYKRDGRIQ